MLIFVMSISLTKAQINLVPNPSFENRLNCNDNYYYLEELIHNWYGGMGYFNFVGQITFQFLIILWEINNHIPGMHIVEYILI
jgi:hypothetical protein